MCKEFARGFFKGRRPKQQQRIQIEQRKFCKPRNVASSTHRKQVSRTSKSTFEARKTNESETKSFPFKKYTKKLPKQTCLLVGPSRTESHNNIVTEI